MRFDRRIVPAVSGFAGAFAAAALRARCSGRPARSGRSTRSARSARSVGWRLTGEPVLRSGRACAAVPERMPVPAALRWGVRVPLSLAVAPPRLPLPAAVLGARVSLRLTSPAAAVRLPLPVPVLGVRVPLSLNPAPVRLSWLAVARGARAPLRLTSPAAPARSSLPVPVLGVRVPVSLATPPVRLSLLAAALRVPATPSRSRPRGTPAGAPAGELPDAVALRAPGAAGRRLLSPGDEPGLSSRVRRASAVPAPRAPPAAFAAGARGAGAALPGAAPAARGAAAPRAGLRADGLPERTGARSGVSGRGCLAVSLTRIDSLKNGTAGVGARAAMKQRL